MQFEIKSLELCMRTNYRIQALLDNPQLLAKIFGATLGGLLVIRWVKASMRRRRLSQKRKQKIAELKHALIRLEEIVDGSELTKEEVNEILGLDITTLQFKLKSGEITPRDVLVAYTKKALKVNKHINCIAEPLLEAFSYADRLSKVKNRDGILFGLPISIKDNIGIVGHDCTIGSSQWIDKPWDEDSAMLKIIRSEGGIPFVKTAVPQTMLSYETSNPIHGQSRNPQDIGRGVGGSSGGEAGLIAAGGSILGVGGDIGGSIRIPAAFCGICGIKPTSYRVSQKGIHPVFKGQTNLRSCFGPMAQSVDGLALLMNAFGQSSAFLADPTLPPIPFKEEVYKNRDRLRIGFYTNLKYLQAVPAMQRAVMEAKEKLEALGHEVVPWNLPIDEGVLVELWSRSALGDGGQRVQEVLKDDEVGSAIKSMVTLLSLPGMVKKVFSSILSLVDRNIGLTLKFTTGEKDVNHWWKLNVKTDEEKEKVIKGWQRDGLDAVICPAFVSPAMMIGAPAYASGAIVYTSIYNVLDFAAGVLPITRVTKGDVDEMVNYPSHDTWHCTVKKSQVGSEGLIVNVQVVTLPWQEEKCLSVMKQLEEAVDFKRDFDINLTK